MKMRKYAALTIAGATLLAACGSSAKTVTTTAGTAVATTAAGSATTAAGTATTAAGTATTAAGATVDCKPVTPGVLSVITSLPGPTWWGSTKAEVDPDSIKSGVEYDLANDIAAKCGLTMKFKNVGFDALVAGQVAKETYDIALSQVTITTYRAKVVDFSVGYYKSDQGILVKTGTKIATWADFKKLKIGVQASTTAEYDFTSGTVPGMTIAGVKSYPDLSSAYAALNAGQVDAIVIDTAINLGEAKQSGGKLTVAAQFKTGEEYGAIFGKGSGKKAIFDPLIQGLIDDGTINTLLAKYLGDPTTVAFIDVPAS